MKNSPLACLTLAALASALPCSPLARAAGAVTGARLLEPARGDGSLSPLEIFGGVGAGYASIVGQDYASAPHGGQYALGADATVSFRSWSLEGGLGWMLSQVSGNDPQGRALSIRIRQATIDFGPRLRLGDRWRVGPLAMTTFGTDTGYAPFVGAGLANVYVGAKASYRVFTGRMPVEVWAQATTDVSISSRQMLASMAGVRIGFPVRGARVSEDALQVGAAAPVREESGRGHESRSSELRVVLDPGKVFFNTASADVRPDVKRILLEVGQMLSADVDGWKAVEVSGHADRRGRFAYNMMLSRKRAASVQGALVQGGADGGRIHVEAHSYLKPADPGDGPLAWARNRRVELLFTDVREPQRLLDLLRPLTEQKPINDRS